MLVKENQLLFVKHTRKGLFLAEAERDFDSEKEEWFPVRVAQTVVFGAVNEWEKGESIPARASLCKIEKVKYLVTDPCYLIDGKGLDSDWDKFLMATDFGDSARGWLLPEKGILIECSGTSYGDGSWNVAKGKTVMADAGMVCILQIARGYEPTEYEGNAITDDINEAQKWFEKVRTE